MPVFISYHQRDEAAYTSLCLALEGQRIEYLDAKTMKVGGSLREQLREIIERCEVYLFLATRNSIDSAWCWAELGAFWGAGIRVVVFISDADLTENQIPPQFQDILCTRDVRQIVSEVETEISAVREKRLAILETKKSEVLKKPRLVSDMTIEMFYNVISSVQSNESRRLFETILLLRQAFVSGTRQALVSGSKATNFYTKVFFNNEVDLQAFALPLLNSLIGVSIEQIKPMGEQFWEESFTLITDTGNWLGFSEEASFTGVEGCENCLLFHFDSSQCDAAVLMEWVGYNSYYSLVYESIIASSGSVALGKPSELKNNNVRP